MDSNQNEIKLWKDMKNGDYQARNILIEKYTPLVKYVAGRVKMIVSSLVEFDDLVSFGIYGLIQAVDRYNPEQGIKFSTYAKLRIHGAIIDGLRDQDWISRSGREKAKRLKEARKKVEQKLGRSPNDEEIAGEMNLTLDEYYELVLQSNIPELTSLDVFIDHETETKLIEVIPDNSPEPDQLLHKEEIIKVLGQAIERLNPQEKLVLALYYYEELTQQEIAQVMDLTPARISQIHAKAILRLRGMLAKKKDLFYEKT